MFLRSLEGKEVESEGEGRGREGYHGEVIVTPRCDARFCMQG
jgi:hypothetical protein